MNTGGKRIWKPLTILGAAFTLQICFAFGQQETLGTKPLLVEENKLKAIYIAQFLTFIKWPDDAQPLNNIFTIGFLGDTPIMEHEEIIRKKVLLPAPQQLQIRKIKKLEEIEKCQVLFISSEEENRVKDIIIRSSGKDILTIGDTPGYGEMGVLINLYVSDNKVKFEINLPAVKQTRLYVSSKLYRLARIINR